MPPQLPLDISIQSITIDGFDPAAQPPNHGPSGGSPPILSYPGSPLYCHVQQNPATQNFDVLVNEAPPHEFPSTGGQLGVITAIYEDALFTKHPISWDVTGLNVSYRGGRLDLSLAFTSDVLDVASLVITQPPMNAAQPDLTPRIGMVVVNAPIEVPPVGYFVYVPIHSLESTARRIASIGITWAKKGGISGPIGGGTVP